MLAEFHRLISWWKTKYIVRYLRSNTGWIAVDSMQFMLGHLEINPMSARNWYRKPGQGDLCWLHITKKVSSISCHTKTLQFFFSLSCASNGSSPSTEAIHQQYIRIEEKKRKRAKCDVWGETQNLLAVNFVQNWIGLRSSGWTHKPHTKSPTAKIKPLEQTKNTRKKATEGRECSKLHAYRYIKAVIRAAAAT